MREIKEEGLPQRTTNATFMALRRAGLLPVRRNGRVLVRSDQYEEAIRVLRETPARSNRLVKALERKGQQPVCIEEALQNIQDLKTHLQAAYTTIQKLNDQYELERERCDQMEKLLTCRTTTIPKPPAQVQRIIDALAVNGD